MNELKYKPRKPSLIMKLFWKAAGGDAFILRQTTYADQVKYFCLGGIVVATAVMAGLSGGYAYYTIFKPKRGDVSTLWEQTGGESLINNIQGFTEPTDIGTAIGALIFAIIWGLIIYNIDRFIVTSTGKGDGTEAITLGELKSALPRIIMGIIIAISISKPLEIRILKGELDRKLSDKQLVEKTKKRKEINARYALTLDGVEKEIATIDSRITQFEEDFDRLQEKIEFEIANGGCKGKCESFKKEQAKIQSKINGIKEGLKYKNLNASKTTLEQDRTAEIANIERDISKMDGLAERIMLAEEHYPVVSWFLTFLFLAIELTPIFFKLMLIKSPYDYLSDNYKELELAESGIYVDRNYVEDEKGVQKELIRYLHAEKQINEQKEIQDLRARLTKYAIEKFEEIEKEKIDDNPDDYIKYS